MEMMMSPLKGRCMLGQQMFSSQARREGPEGKETQAEARGYRLLTNHHPNGQVRQDLAP